jgi:hypothetical protein
LNGLRRGELLHCEIMWCPSATLSVWGNAWLAGKAAPDDVLDALSSWAAKQTVAAYDAVAAGHTGLPWPDIDDAGLMSLLQTLRTAAGRPPTTQTAIYPLLPVPGDVRGLPAGTQFERDALTAGEAMIIRHPDDPAKAVGLVPEFTDNGSEDSGSPEFDALAWTVYSLPEAPVFDQPELGEAEYTLRSAVRSAANALDNVGLSSGGVDVEDPRGLVEQLLESAGRHPVPDHAPSRAVRVLQTAAHIDAIITVSAGLSHIGTQSLLQAQIATDTLRPLAMVVRDARIAAITAILHSAWRD